MAYRAWGILSRHCREWFLQESKAARPGDLLPCKTLMKGVSQTDGRCPHQLMHAVREAATVAGWVLDNPHTIRDRSGRKMELLAASPAKLHHVFLRQARQHQAHLSAVKRADEHGLADSLTQHGLDEGTVRQVIQASGKKALDHAAREVLRAAFAGGFVTLADLQRRGILRSCECPWCGWEDTVAHRLFTNCEDPAAPGRRATRANLGLDALYTEAGGRDERKELLPLFLGR